MLAAEFRDVDGTQPRDDHGRWTDTGAPSALATDADLTAAFTFHNDLYSSSVLGVQTTFVNPYAAATVPLQRTRDVVSELYDPHTGQRIGTSVRAVDIEHHSVEHSKMEIDPEFQGKGIGAAYLRDSVDMYRRNGIERITTTAVSNDGQTSNGAYTWARLGFTPIDRDLPMLAERLRKAAGASHLSDAKLTEYLRFADRVASGRATIQDVANDRIGKRMLLGAFGEIEWNGYMNIDRKAKT